MNSKLHLQNTSTLSPKVQQTGLLAALLLTLGGVLAPLQAHAQSFVAEEIPLAPIPIGTSDTPARDFALWNLTSIDNAGTVAGVRGNHIETAGRYDEDTARFDLGAASNRFDAYVARAGVAPALFSPNSTVGDLPVLGYGVGTSPSGGSGGVAVATVFWPGGSYPIGRLPGTLSHSVARDMNTSGTVVGYSGQRWYSSDGARLNLVRAFVWSPFGGRDGLGRAVPSLDELPGLTTPPSGFVYDGSLAEAVNNAGVIGGAVGMHQEVDGANVRVVPVLWFGSNASDRVAVDLSPYFPSSISPNSCRVRSINDQFVIVARCGTSDVFYTPSTGRFAALSTAGTRIEAVNESSCFAANIAGRPIFSCPLQNVAAALDNVATPKGASVRITNLIDINDRNEILAEGPTEYNATSRLTQQHFYVLRPR